MEAHPRTVKKLLQGDRRFIIPIYQRPYVWNRDRQWEPLWNDVETTAIKLVQARIAAKANEIPFRAADKEAPPHFLGAIVLEQYSTPTGKTDVRSVVDGQQRLTTLQLLLRGVLDALEESGAERPLKAQVRKLIRNDEDVVSGDEVHKVWPRLHDRNAYEEAVAAAPISNRESPFSAARAYFAKAAAKFLQNEHIPPDPYGVGEPHQQRASLLVAALLDLVKVVVIDLGDVDDAQIIFEALNARNTPLSAADLVKNLLFMQAQAAHHDIESLYNKRWARFDSDEDWWRATIGSGHAQRARMDWLLGDFIIAQLGQVINVGRLYGEFRAWLSESRHGPVVALEMFNGYADAYEKMYGRRPGATPAELTAFRRIRQLNITAAVPVLLWLLDQSPEVLPTRQRELAVRAIESFVVRRMAAKWQTRTYAQAFAEVLRAARATPERAGRAIVDALQKSPHGCGWPTDHDLKRRFRNARYYGPGGINQGRLRLLLGAVDEHLQAESHKAEPVRIDYGKLQVDHVIPQDWRKHWPVYHEEENARLLLEQRREEHVNRLGNLTLVSSRLNPAMGNDPWAAKRAELGKHSKLRLNALLCEEERWAEEEICARGEWLATRLSLTWPGPDARAWSPDLYDGASARAQ